MRKILAAFAALTLGLGGVLAIAGPANATKTDPNADHKITLCHRTGSAEGGELKNGYNEITVDIASSGYVKGGHTNHEQVGNGPGPDIIPAYDAYAKDGKEWVEFSFPGKGLDWVFTDGTTGQEFLDNGCQLNNPKPDPIVEVEESTVDRMSCEAGVEEKTTVVTLTTDYVLVEGEWVLGETVKTVDEGDWTFVRDLTNAELTELECVDEPNEPNEPVEPTEPEEPVLPATGGNGPGLAAGIALALATLGGIAFAASRRRGTDSI
jgi:hypothetical protein